MRVLLRLCKGDEVKYLSHRDVIRAFEFALRRAQIPVAYSAGFNPRPRMSFGLAVGVGVTSDDELIVLELASPTDPSDIKERLNSQLPAGMEVLSAESVPDGAKSPSSEVNASQFRITAACGTECDPASISRAIDELFAAGEVVILRVRDDKAKEVDIRPHLLLANLVECSGRSVVIDVSLKCGDSGGARPQDFIQAIGRLVPDLETKKIHRVKQFHA